MNGRSRPVLLTAAGRSNFPKTPTPMLSVEAVKRQISCQSVTPFGSARRDEASGYFSRVEPVPWTRSVAPGLWRLWGPAISVVCGMPSCYEPSGVTTPLSVHLGFRDLGTFRAVQGISMDSNHLTFDEFVCACGSSVESPPQTAASLFFFGPRSVQR